MDKYEYKVKLAQIEKLVAKKDYVTAAKIADGIDWRKVKSVTTLNMIADIYEANDRLEDCYEILNMVYDRSPIGRRVVYRMTEIATKMHDFEEAIDLYREFVRLAPHDLSRYVLKYQIYRERGSSVTDQITILEEYKNHEYDERWSYELACLYEEAGQISRCIEECDELILWFSEGEYVVKAMELKMKYQELTASQQEKYDHRFDYLKKEAAEQEESPEEKKNPDILPEESAVKIPEKSEQPAAVPAEAEDDTPKVSVINTNKFSTINLQEELAKGLQMFLDQKDEEEPDEEPATEVAEEEPAIEESAQETVAQESEEIPAEEETIVEEAIEKADTQEFIQVKEVVIPRTQGAEEVTVEEPTVVEESTVVEEPAEKVMEETMPEEPAEEVVEETMPEEPVEEVKEEIQPQEPAVIQTEEKKTLSETAELQTELLKYVAVPQEPKMEEMLRTEEDGQISLAIGDENILEKQITGQMTIEEILEAWEEKKRQAKEQIDRAGEKKNTVLFETGEITSLLEDFIPRTPKEIPPVKDEIEAEVVTEAEVAVGMENVAEAEAATEAETVAEAEVAVEIETVAEAATETEIIEETEAEEVTEPEPVIEPEVQEEAEDQIDEEFEDDLPQDIDFSEALETALQEPKKEEQPIAEKEEEVQIAEEKKVSVTQDTASMLEAIERALTDNAAPMETSEKYLTEEQEEIFAYFTSVNGMKKQLITLVSEDSVYAGKEDSKTGNLIITGHPGNGKTTLAIDIVKAFQKQRDVKGSRIAKVTGDGLNKKNPEEVVQKLGGGALIIERAGSLSDKTVKKLSAVMEGYTGGLLIILEDDSEEISGLLGRNEGFAAKFNRSIDIPLFSNDELVEFGKSYAEEHEFYFDEMAILALYDCIGVRQTSDHVVNITEVKEMMDEAIAHAEKKSKGFFARILKKRIDEDGNKLLLEEDFDF